METPPKFMLMLRLFTTIISSQCRSNQLPSSTAKSDVRYTVTQTDMPWVTRCGRKFYCFYEWLCCRVSWSLGHDFNMICRHMALWSLHGLAMNLWSRHDHHLHRSKNNINHFSLPLESLTFPPDWLVGWRLLAFLSSFPKPKPEPQVCIGTRPVRVVADHRSQVFQDLEVDRRKMSMAYSQGIVWGSRRSLVVWVVGLCTNGLWDG